MNDIILDDSISETRTGLPKIASVESVKVPFYTNSKINEPENQINDLISDLINSIPENQNVKSLNNSLNNDLLNISPNLDNSTILEYTKKRAAKKLRKQLHLKREEEDRDIKRKAEIAKKSAEKAKATKNKKKTPSEELERLKKQEDIDPSLILSNKRVAKPRYSNYRQ